MSYEKKYLKYKTKYLSLKSQFISKNLMTGGSNDNSFENLDLFSETITSPSIDANFKLVSLLNNFKGGAKNNDSQTPVAAASSDNASSETPVAAISSDTASITPINSESSSEVPEKSAEVSSDASEIAQTPEKSAKVSLNASSQIAQTPENNDLNGGAKKSKVKSHKKYFFDDSDVNLDSTTTDSDLSSLDTDSTDDSD